MKHLTILSLMIVLMLVVTGQGGKTPTTCSGASKIDLEKDLRAKQKNGLKLVDQAGTYSQRLNAMKSYNAKARKLGCSRLLTEQDHMPPKAAITAASGALRNRLYGSGPNDMLAMTYLKPSHRQAGTTGRFRGVTAVQNLITDAINSGNVVLTYKYAVLATNSDVISSAGRNFKGYMDAYVARLGSLITAAGRAQIQTWTNTVLRSETQTEREPAYQRLLNAYYAAQEDIIMT